MRRLIGPSLIILTLLLAACRRDADAIPTQVPTVTTPDSDAASASPRPTDNPADRLPPTWTPQPTPDGLESENGELTGRTDTPTNSQAAYIVQPGDTLGTIAETYGVSITDLARANSIGDIDHIEVGQQLIIP